jgi:hypothetical protein
LDECQVFHDQGKRQKLQRPPIEVGGKHKTMITRERGAKQTAPHPVREDRLALAAEHQP